MMNNFSNGYYQQGMVPNSYVPNGMFPQQNGVTFNQVAPQKQTSSTPEELETIRKHNGSSFKFDPDDAAVAGWDYREGTDLCIQLVDKATERVKVKYTGEEFNIVTVGPEVVQESLNILHNIVCTTKLLNTSLDPNVSKQIYVAYGVLEKLLPIAYENGKKNYGTIWNQVSQQVGVTGYFGNNGYNNFMFNGQIGAAPNYFVNDGSSIGAINPYAGMPNPGMQPGFNTAVQAAVQATLQQMGMGAPSQPNGGTMMGGNPFVQGGQPQVVPQMVQPSVPFPGQQIQQQPPQQTVVNPSIGAQVQNQQQGPFSGNPSQQATTTTAPF